jgi:hypothetical protein
VLENMDTVTGQLFDRLQPARGRDHAMPWRREFLCQRPADS